MNGPTRRQKSQAQRIFGEEEDVEKLYLAAAEKGDVHTLEYVLKIESLDVNCVDRKGNTALNLAIKHGHVDAMKCLLRHDVYIGDSLLRAVDVQTFRGVQILCEYSKTFKGRSINIINCRSDNEDFHPDITPLVLAAHHNNYDIIKILLRHSASIDDPESINRVTEKHTLQHSLGTLNVYKALASEAYISLTNEDPIDKAFKLSVKLRDMSTRDYEFRQDYIDLSERCEQFAADLLGQTRDTQELTTILTHGKTSQGDSDLPYKVFHAVKLEQKLFVAHPHCQQLLIERWYHGLSNWRDKSMLQTVPISIAIGFAYPLLSLLYILAPCGRLAKFITIPYVKFLMNTASYMTFLVLLFFSSDTSFIGSFGLEDLTSLHNERIEELSHLTLRNRQRGPAPNNIEILIVTWLIAMTWSEMKEIYNEGCITYIKNPYNLIDFTQLALYWSWVSLRITSILMVNNERQKATQVLRRSLDNNYTLINFIDDEHEHLKNFTRDELNNLMTQMISNMTSLMEYFHRTSGLQNTVSNLTALLSDYSYYIKKASLSNQPSILDPSDYGYDDVSYSVPIDEWNQWDPTLVSSVTFAVANVLSVLRLLRVIVMNDLVGPLQISLSKMNYDIFKFLFIFFFVWVAFGLGISQIYWLYAANNELQCLQEGFETVKECTYEPFGSLSKSMETLFWSLFGLLEPDILRIDSNHVSTEWFGTVLYGMYYIIAVVVLLNLLIALMSNTYTKIEKNSDTEWKYFRSEMWMSYFEGATIPPPFNILPSPKFVYHAFMAGYLCVCKKAARVKTQKKQQKNVKKQEEYQRIVNQLVVRYFGNVASGHHGRGGQGDKVTKVEFMEFKQDMSSFRYEQLGMVQKLERNMSITNSHINGLVLRLVQMEKINIDVLSVIKEQLLKKSEDHTDMIQGLERKLEESHTEVLAHHGIGNENVRSIAEQLRMQHNRQQHPIPSYINTQRRESQVQANEYDILFATRVNKDPMPTIPVEEELVTENDIDVSHIQLDPKVNEEDVAISLDSNNEVQDFVDAITHGLELREEEEAGEDEEDLEQGEDDLSSYRFEQVMGSSVPVPVLRQSFQVDYDHRLPWQHNSRVGKSPRFQQYMNVFENWEKTDFENI